ncbi:family 43 glycosylhydrolase [Paraflavitalea sp. CAU 1676]|uniref:family 43 glycosylhydrolase n=1 Tax=Paraflavitalea sp. CAU 1676 TaxID=3032598 RepID=UPI0023DB3FE7|nr:family 43 glycosylhydrolase [Paraflavitalea sp. CAU 1676]MDF2193235.1 family 43 glycosylhydrolase [Paraflavitalea sp. CAU 1676]
MKRSIFIFALLLNILICYSQNPFITSIYTADPSAHVWADGRLYVYPSHDIDPARGCDLMDRYHVFSTDDLVNWRDEGEILRSSQVSWGRKEGGFMWAPDCAYKNGTYYFYYPHPSGTDWNKTWKIGIATSDKPASGFTPGGYIEGLSGNAMIDPAVFIDTDGLAYFYYGGGSVCQGGKLKDNMTEINGSMQNMEGLVDFHEAAWVFKRNGLYYLTYADNTKGQNQLRYATSNHPLGPWKHQGVFLGQTGCDTNHGSVVEYKGKWYIFYHNQSLSHTGHGNLRSICVDYIHFNEDGTIRLVEQTKTGIAPAGKVVKRSDNGKGAQYKASKASLQGTAAVAGGDANGRQYVTGFGSKEAAIEFNQVDGGRQGGRATLTIHYAAPAFARVKLFVNNADFSLLNTVTTGSPTAFIGKASLTVPLQPGKSNTIRIIGGWGEVNIDHISVCPIR